MPYTYDYTKAAAGSESPSKHYWRLAKMTLTRWTRAKTFVFDGRSYPYLYHFCNKTWNNERGVEIPIFREILLRHQVARILEVGNVLSHYFPIHHDVVDKYEVAPGVINQDIVEFVPTERYDLILSISTVEHLGWDEEPREPSKLLRAIEHLQNRCLAPGGQIVASLPVGYNEFFDGLLREGKSPLPHSTFSSGSRNGTIGWNLIGTAARTRPTAISSPTPSASGSSRDNPIPCAISSRSPSQKSLSHRDLQDL